MTTKKTTKKNKKKTATDKKPTIDRVFSGIIMPLTTEELGQLERNLLAAGRCRDPLVVWKGRNILVDGHNRLTLCEKHKLASNVVEMEFADQDAVMDWIRQNQLGRRNLAPEAMSYLRGQHYNAEKNAHGGDRKSAESSGNDCHLKTDATLAEQYKVAPKTIHNDADFAKDLDAITKICEDDFKNALLRREVKLSRGQVKELANMEKERLGEAVKKVIEAGKMQPDQKAGSGTLAVAAPTKMEKITVPTAPLDMARMLLLRLGPAGVGKVQEALEKVLAEHQAKHKKGKTPKPVTQP